MGLRDIWPGSSRPTPTAAGWYLFAWGVFTGLMFIGTLRINRALQTVFFTLTVLFVLLAIGKWVGERRSSAWTAPLDQGRR